MILADTYEFDLMCVNYSSDGSTSADGRFVSDCLINSAILPTPQLSDCKESEFTSQFGSTADFNSKSSIYCRSCYVPQAGSLPIGLHYEDHATDP